MFDHLLLEAYKMAITLDINNKRLLGYSYHDKKIDTCSQGKLTIVNTKIGVIIENHFKIELSDYGVETYDELFTFKRARNVI